MDFIFNGKAKELTFNDQANERQVVFQYRDPTAEERIKYNGRITALFRNKVKGDEGLSEEISRVQFEYGFEILGGFRVSGVPSNISSDPAAADFNPEWKRMVSDRATELVILLGRHVFEGAGYVPQKN